MLERCLDRIEPIDQQPMRQLSRDNGARIDEIKCLSCIEYLPDEVRLKSLTHALVDRCMRAPHVCPRIPGSSVDNAYTGCTSKPPNPPAFMAAISRSSSVCVTAGPNHHQGIIGRASSGGCWNRCHI